MGRAGTVIRGSVRTEIATHCLAGESILVSGPIGSGKSHLLSAVADQLSAGGAPVHLIDGADDAALAVVSAAPAGTALVLDGLERARPELLRACLDRLGSGEPLVMSLTIGPQHASCMHALDAASAGSPAARDALAAVRRVELEPIAARELEWLLHERSAERLDSGTVHRILTLASGRPGWAVDLLQLAQHGYLSERPRPWIVEAPHGELDLPALRALARELGSVTPEAATAALALSELGATDLAGARDLVGSGAVAELVRCGAFVKQPGAEEFSVPVFVAAALRDRVSADILERQREAIAQRLAVQEALGIQLSEADVLLYARSLSGGAQADSSGAGNALGAVGAARHRVLQRAVSHLVAFTGESTARTILLRSGPLDGPTEPLLHARTVSALVGPAAALEALASGPRPEGGHDLLLHEFLRAQFAAESGFAAASAAADLDAETAALLRDATAVFTLWNTAVPAVGPDVRRGAALGIIAARSSSPEVAGLAGALVDLDHVWHGALPPRSWLATGAAIPMPREQHTDFARTASGALLFAHALTAFLAGEHALRADELRAAAARTVPHDSHARWLRHLLSAGEALACGDPARASDEWTYLTREAPRFIPVRLRGYLQRVGAAIRLSADPDGAGADALTSVAATPVQIAQYLSGQHDALAPAARRAGNAAGTLPLPLLRLAHAHLQAATDQNPARLLRTAHRLMQLELWAPTAFALRTARQIFLSRRAVGGVQQCDERLAALEDQLTASVPWYRSGDLPAVAFAQLTPREREAAALAAEGRSNREIAHQLGCGVRTVESHLSQARAKLGSSSRRDLAARLTPAPVASAAGATFPLATNGAHSR
ncbi:LuxR C-terminal-related transcriptional regulator [Leucobacter luti]|uniref:DNA-binding CsgD family transcriptional regulator n=2 Tax=Leucobacter luti TaxID=340320 RepID=A0A4Q7TR68_9MICO|nr:LuxR C-terminal-related transcriptional regulator [Leucobacter luti]MBL3699997.1 hypothetical protein [Leucobacter luti]RZT62687.1 DNA-binding CsgD family transcriptional regulator [Leucobacter luti]